MIRRDSDLTVENLANYETAWSATEYTREAGLRPLEASLVVEFFPPPPADILDIGCGAGRTTVGLARAGYRVTAIDLSPALLEQARRQYTDLDFRLMDATDLTFSDAGFDAALFSYNGIDCIYPLSARVRCLSEVWRVLRPGGTFLLSSHNLVGTLFSGGYWYLPGYWNAAKLLARQWGNRVAREWYVRYDDGGGVQHLYSAPPSHTIRQLAGVGFEVLGIRGGSGERQRGAIARRAQHVHFVARKLG